MTSQTQEYKGSCHCGSVQFSFVAPKIEQGVKCNCSICIKKNALMSADAFSGEELKLSISNDALATYEFGTGIAKHHFCKRCGIYPFHQTLRKPGYYRVNLACVEGLDISALPFSVFDGASL